MRATRPGWCSSSLTFCISTARTLGPLIERDARLTALLSGVAPPLHYSDYQFIVVGWTDPEGRRPWLGALLLAYHHDPDGRLVYAGRAGTGIKQAELARLWRRPQPLAAPDKGTGQSRSAA